MALTEYAQQLEAAICTTLELWTRDYPLAWPVLDVLAGTPQAFMGAGGKVLKPWYDTMTPEWVDYANGRLAALTMLYYKPEQVLEAIAYKRTWLPEFIHKFFKGDGRHQMDWCTQVCQAAEKYFPEQASACSIPLVKIGA